MVCVNLVPRQRALSVKLTPAGQLGEGQGVELGCGCQGRALWILTSEGVLRPKKRVWWLPWTEMGLPGCPGLLLWVLLGTQTTGHCSPASPGTPGGCQGVPGWAENQPKGSRPRVSTFLNNSDQSLPTSPAASRSSTLPASAQIVHQGAPASKWSAQSPVQCRQGLELSFWAHSGPKGDLSILQGKRCPSSTRESLLKLS